jgi:hypothetical protein
MRTTVIGEYGYEQALFGCGLSHGLTSEHDFNGNTWPKGRMEKVAQKLSCRDGGHNKLLESIVVWLDIEAPRYWWQEFDTYRVGTTKQSESTIHTMTKRELTVNDFEGVDVPTRHIEWLNSLIRGKDWLAVKNNLPESFLQRRIACTNYKVLRNVILQRRKHKLELWRKFIRDVLKRIEHPELLPGLKAKGVEIKEVEV